MWPLCNQQLHWKIIRFVKSRNDDQMRDSGKESSTSGCGYQRHIKVESVVPCSIATWSMFNDTYSFSRKNMSLAVNRKGISWKSDRDRKYGSNVFPSNFQKGPIIGSAHLDQKIPVNLLLYIYRIRIPNLLA
jgi:hypothetical protein